MILNFWSKSVNKVHLRIKVSLQAWEGMSRHFSLLQKKMVGRGARAASELKILLYSRTPGDTGKNRCPQVVITPYRV